MTIIQLAPTIPTVEAAWTLYADLFAEIDTLAAQRHLMTYDEFSEVYHNADVLKFYCYDDTNALVGMSVLTRKLDAWPLISPRFFARRFPEHYARKAIWYVGFVGVRPNHSHGFRELVTRMYPHVINTDGLAVMDFCTHNGTVRRLPEITQLMLGRINSAASMDLADAQSFVIYRFDQPTREA